MQLQSLNGFWDFLPLHQAEPKAEVPREGWLPAAYLVPSFWNVTAKGVRRSGEKWFRHAEWKDLPRDPAALAEYEFLFDTQHYPVEWNLAESAWARRSFEVSALAAEERVLIDFDAVASRCRVFVNGTPVGANLDPSLPFSLDVTSALHEGGNELAVLIQDYQYLEGTRQTLAPSGGPILNECRGIWQNVTLRRTAAVRIAAVAIRTRVAAAELEIEWELINTSDRAFSGPLEAEISDFATGAVLRKLSAENVELAPRGAAVITRTYAGVTELPQWNPEAPRLCRLNARLAGEDFQQRFGWREVTFEGKDLKINGRITHLASDWGHKWTDAHLTEGWNRKWFAMMREANLNHSRLHSFPHPPLVMDLADELGILITVETAIYGSGFRQASGSPEYWRNAEDHVRRMIRRDRNHPSVILWSVENEMRWNRDREGLTDRELPRLRHLMTELDPTRVSYHDGDSSLWDEKDQPIVSRHYCKACSGVGWWDRKQPLLSSEMSVYHMAGPNNTCHFGGDAVWADYALVKHFSGLDAAWIVEDGRALGAVGFHPWNLVCLENYRYHPAQKIDWPDWNAPGAKPRFLTANSCELEFWQPEGVPGFHPSELFDIQKHAFRPFALIDTNRRTGYYPGTRVRRTLALVNDLPYPVTGTLTCEIPGAKAFSRTVTLESGECRGEVFEAVLPAEPQNAFYRAAFTAASGELLDSWTAAWRIAAPEKSSGLKHPVRVFGSGVTCAPLANMGIAATVIADLNALEDDEILILEPFSVPEDPDFQRQIAAFADRGGRVLVMEQRQSLFADAGIAEIPLQKLHMRMPEHPVLAGIAPEDLEFWGDDPYSALEADNFLCRSLYAKGDGAQARYLLDGGDGAFGNGSMEGSALLEVPQGQGLVIASQLRLTAAEPEIPAARRLWLNILQRLDAHQPAEYRAEKPLLPFDTALERALTGETVWTCVASDADARRLAAATGITTVTRKVLQLAKTAAAAVRNVCNEDACGIVTWTYCNPSLRNIRVAERVFEPHPALEAWLTTAPRSALTELYAGSGRTEALRSHTLSRLWSAPEAPLVGAGSVPIGRGRLILWQVAPEEEWPRFARLRRAVAMAVDSWFPSGGLTAPVTPQLRGTGAPEVLQWCDAGGIAEEALMLAATPTSEHLFCSAMMTLAPWRTLEVKEGEALIPQAPRKVLFYSVITSPVPRPEFDPDLRVPNPEAMTVCELSGRGEVRLFLNGKKVRTEKLNGEVREIGDLYFERTVNSFVLLFEPEGADAEISIHFRNLFRKPETSLVFG